MLDETFEVREGATLRLGLHDANVRVETGHASPARVQVTLEGDDMEQARDYYERRGLRVRGEDGGIALTSQSIDMRGGFFGDPTGGARIHVLVTLPTAFNLSGSTDDGDVTLDGALEGSIDLTTDDGAIHLQSVTGPTITLRTEDGDARATDLTGDDITWEADDGNLDVETITAKQRVLLRAEDGDLAVGALSGPDIEIRSDDGNVRVRHLSGRLTASLADGDFHAETVEGEHAEIQTDDGSIAIERLAAATSQLQSDDGSVRIGALSGELHAETEDSTIEIDLAAASPVTLHANDGPVRLSLPASLAVTLDLDAEAIDLDDAFASDALDIGDEYVRGPLNGGGPTIEVQADGTIEVRSR